MSILVTALVLYVAVVVASLSALAVCRLKDTIARRREVAHLEQQWKLDA